MPTPRNISPANVPTYNIPNLFQLAIICTKTHANITMQLFMDDVTTRNIPHVQKLLQAHLPTILRSKCFNEKNLPFSQEVAHTEIGHLFEHILLEYLCKEKISSGSNEAIFSGVTKWNWKKDAYGTFHIQIDVTWQERDIFYFALEQSIFLLKRILLPQVKAENVFFEPFMLTPTQAAPMSSLLKSITTEEQMD